MQTILNGIETFYEVQGPETDLPVVLIHGFPFSSAMWEPQVEAFKGFCRVITYDVRGHGRSGVGDGQYLVEFFVDDLIALLDHLKVSSAVLCGLSMGGYIALRAVDRNPERVKALVLADTRSEGDPNEGKLKRANAMTVIAKDPGTFVDGFLKSVFTAGSIAAQTPETKKIHATMKATSPMALRGTLLALAARMDMTASLPAIKVPTLILVGSDDAVTPPSASEAMHAKINGSTLVVIPNASHLSSLENAAAFNQAAMSFLKGLK